MHRLDARNLLADLLERRARGRQRRPAVQQRERVMCRRMSPDKGAATTLRTHAAAQAPRSLLSAPAPLDERLHCERPLLADRVEEFAVWALVLRARGARGEDRSVLTDDDPLEDLIEDNRAAAEWSERGGSTGSSAGAHHGMGARGHSARGGKCVLPVIAACRRTRRVCRWRHAPVNVAFHTVPLVADDLGRHIWVRRRAGGGEASGVSRQILTTKSPGRQVARREERAVGRVAHL